MSRLNSSIKSNSSISFSKVNPKGQKMISSFQKSVFASPQILHSQPKTAITLEESEELFLKNYKKKDLQVTTWVNDESVVALNKKEGFKSPFLREITASNNIQKIKGPSNIKLRVKTAEYHDDYYLGGKGKYSLTTNYKKYNEQFLLKNFNKDGTLIFDNKNNETTENEKKNLKERGKSEDLSKMISAKNEEKKFISNMEQKVLFFDL